jgi:hypothetical protein
LREAKAEIDALRAGAEAEAVPAANLRSPQEEIDAAIAAIPPPPDHDPRLED